MTSKTEDNELTEGNNSVDFKEVHMYLLSNYPFYYGLLQQCRITFDSKTQYIAYVKVSTKMEMVINPKAFSNFSTAEQAGLIVHEMQHLFKDHIKQSNLKQVEALADKMGSEPNHMQANIAMDAEINPFISEIVNSNILGPNAPVSSKFKGVNPSDFNLDRGDSWFNYYIQLEDNKDVKQMKKNQKTIDDALERAAPGPGGPHQNHEYFKDSTKDGKLLDEIVANAAERAKALSSGHTPSEVEKFLIEHEMSKELPWNIILKQFMQSLISVNTKNTWKKVNRRFRGKLPGAKRIPRLELLIGIDSSGSVSDDDLVKFYCEVDAINAVGNITIDVAVFDTVVHQREEYRKGFKASRICGGGTSFTGVHDIALEERYKGVIYLSDGYAEFPDKDEVNYKCLWVLNNNHVTPPYGQVVRIK